MTSLVVQWSETLTTNHKVPDSIPGSTVAIFLEGEDSRGDHGLGRLVEFRFKAPPGTTSSSITTHTPSGQRNCASWGSQPQKSVTLLPCPGGRTTKSTKDMWWHWGEKIVIIQFVLTILTELITLTGPGHFVFLFPRNISRCSTLVSRRRSPGSVWGLSMSHMWSCKWQGNAIVRLLLCFPARYTKFI